MENQNDVYVKKWLTGLSDRTKENYLREFPKWQNFIKMSPTEQINKRLKDLSSANITERSYFEGKFREFKEALEKEGKLSAISITTELRTVASFFSRNDLGLNLKHGDWKTTLTQEVKKPQFKLKQEDIKAMYAHANLRDRTLLLVLAQSGFSEIDVSELKIEDIQGLWEMNPTEHYYIQKNREKTNFEQATCLSCEFLHDLRSLLEEQGKPEKGFIFVSQTKPTKNEKGEIIESSIDTRRINEIMKNLAIKTFGTEKAKTFKTKALRSFYNSALLRADIKSEVKDLLMGHARLGSRSHYSYDDVTIKEAYAKAFEHLSINGIQVKEDIAKMKEDLTKIIGQQQIEINNLKELFSTENLKKLFEKVLEDYTTEHKQ